MDQKKISRRSFVVGTAATVASYAIRASGGRAGRRPVSPNEKLNIAGIGVGGKGADDMRKVSSENIVALCDVDGKHGAGTFKRYPKAKRYRDFRVMLEKQPEIDAVTISTPDHVHAVATMTAMELGKHVYVQKPLTHSIYEARMLTRAARKYKVATQMGNQGHSIEGIRRCCEMIWSGAIGQVREVHAWTHSPIWPQGIPRPTETPPVPDSLDWGLWLGPAPYRPYHPAYLPFKWRGWWDFGGGALADMGCHIIDPAFWALKLGGPCSVEVVSQEGCNKETGPTKEIIRWEFSQRGDMAPVTVYWYDGGHKYPRPEGVPEDEELGDPGGKQGGLFIGDKVAMTVGHHGEDPRLLPSEKMRDYRMPPKIIARVPDQNHFKDWIRACKGGTPACSNFDYAGPLTEMVLLGTVAVRVQGKLEWNSKEMKFTNNSEANQYIKRDYRKGWTL